MVYWAPCWDDLELWWWCEGGWNGGALDDDALVKSVLGKGSNELIGLLDSSYEGFLERCIEALIEEFDGFGIAG